MSRSSINIRDYVVERTTTEKLEVLLNDMAQDYDEIQPTFTGGRDWVVVGSRPFVPGQEPTVFGNTNRAARERVTLVP